MKKINFISIVLYILFLSGLYLTSLYNYLLFHSLAEMFSIVIACSIFLFTWNSRRYLDNNYLLFMGIAYLYIGSLDLVHTLGYPGMGVFKGYGSNLATQTWIATRYVECISFLLAPMFFGRKLRINLVVTAYSVIIFLLLASIFYWNIFPDAFIEGVGLTPFKKTSEYIISGILLAAIYLLYQKREKFSKDMFRLLILSIVATICSELFFTLYEKVYGFFNMMGHYLKIISFYLIYMAIIKSGLMKPHELLLRNLKLSEKTLETFPSVSWVADRAGRISYISPNVERIYGYTPEEIYRAGESLWSDWIHPDSIEKVNKAFADLFNQGKPFNIEHRIKRKEGGWAWLYNTAMTVYEKDGTHYAYGVFSDISDRKKAEQTLIFEKDKFINILNTMEDGVYIVNQQYDIEYINPILKREFGDIEGRKCYEYFHDRKEICPWCKNKEVFKGKTIHWEWYSLKNQKTYDLIDTPLRNPDGSISKLEIFRDITKRKKMENDLKDAKVEIEAWNRALEERVKEKTKQLKDAQEELIQSERMSVLGKLSSSLAHEINNPLGVIDSSVYYLKMMLKDADEKTLEHLDRIKSQVDASCAIIESLRNLTRLKMPSKVRIDITNSIKEGMMMANIPDGINVISEMKESKLLVSADKEQLAMVFRNLTENAVQGMEGKGTLWVNASVGRDDLIEVTFRDSGPGIAPDHLEKIFQPFFTTKAKGIGFGLALCRIIIERHGGTITASSEQDKGATLTVRLPSFETNKGD